MSTAVEVVMETTRLLRSVPGLSSRLVVDDTARMAEAWHLRKLELELEPTDG